jgi:drug/metabolite transporter (DMT)-like permease
LTTARTRDTVNALPVASQSSDTRHSGYSLSIPPQLRAVLLVVLASACFAAMHNAIRYVSRDIHPFEIAFFRNAFGVLYFVPWLATSGLGALKTSHLGTHAARALFNATSMLAWFTALSLIPVADATSLALAGPVFTALGAKAFLGETVDRRRWAGIAVATVGAIVIIRPGIQAIGPETGIVLFSALCVSVSKLMAKSLSRTEGTATIVIYLMFLMMLITAVPASLVWQWPNLMQLGVLAMIGTFGTTGHVLFVQAYKLADVSLLEPVMFTRMVWAALIGFVVFAECSDVWTWAGAAVIVIGTTFVTGRRRGQHTGETLP